ncbi:MAG: putative lipoprotein [Labilithrix sp.]|nr:putative lipoprotein [Labilithrix sp.]
MPLPRLRLHTALPMLAALVAAGHGSAEAAPGGGPTLRPTEAQVCRGFTAKLLEGVTVAPALGKADYLELREEPGGFGPAPAPNADGGAPPPPVVLARKGTPCATATDTKTCVAGLHAARSRTGFAARYTGSPMAPQPIVTYLVATFGDRVEVVASPEELRGFVAPVDTTSDVELVAGCGRMLKTDTGWELTKLYTDSGSCFGGTGGWTRHTVSADGVVALSEDHTVSRAPTCMSGRRPSGLAASKDADRAHDTLAAFLAECAHLEAASVIAFERMAGELAALGAPASVVRRARRSADDERRHATTMDRFLRDAGGTRRGLDVAPAQPRSLLAMALENAVEGCIHETYGALVAHYQSGAATNAEFRSAMRVIAKDETAHATLAWDVAAWLETRLTVDERQQVDDARQHALAELVEAARHEASEELRGAAGLPGAREAQQLLAGLRATLTPAIEALRAA